MKTLITVTAVLLLGAGLAMTLKKRGRAPAAGGGSLSWRSSPVVEKTLRISIETEATCAFGDRDAIVMDLDHDPKSSLVVSLESIDGTPRQLGYSVLDRSAFLKGDSIEVGLQPGDFRGTAVLYLCRDAVGSGGCYAKEALSPTDLVVKNTIAAGEKNPVPPHRTYWLAPVRIEDKALRVLQTEPPIGSEAEWKAALIRDPLLAKLPGGIAETLAQRLFALRPKSGTWIGALLKIGLTQRSAALCASK